jgi:hypothetical protein
MSSETHQAKSVFKPVAGLLRKGAPP